MLDLSIDFTWFQDPQGYRPIPAKPIALRRGQSILDVPMRDIQPARIVRNGGKLQPYRPFEFPSDLLIKEFIGATKSENGMLEFVKRFGPLTYEGLRGRGEIVWELRDQANEMSEVMLGRIYGKVLGKLNVSISSQREGIYLKVEPPDLLSALWLLVARTKRKRQCLQCNRALIGLRADAKFCSDACRIAFNSLERTRKKRSR